MLLHRSNNYGRIKTTDFTNRGWVESVSGLPKDLFYSKKNTTEPWKGLPHLHLNYAISGALQSLTFKDKKGNRYLYSNKKWDETKVVALKFSPLNKEITFVQSYIKT